MAKNKINKDSVLEGFSLKLALVDLLPVIFFLLATLVLGLMLNSVTFIIGAIITFVAGAIKVLWKIIVSIKKKNIWWMFVQMRIVMPIGFILMIIGLIVYFINNDSSLFFIRFNNIVSILFLVLGFIGMIAMTIFAFKLDSSDPKSNWIEQICNAISQACFFVSFLLAFIL